MQIGYEFTFLRLYSPELVSVDSLSIAVHVRWKHYRRVSRPTTPIADEPIGTSRSSRFGLSLQPFPEFLRQTQISVESLNFPRWLSYPLAEQIACFGATLIRYNLTGFCTSPVLDADFNFIHGYTDEIIPPHQLAASADENSTPHAASGALVADGRFATFETFTVRGSLERRYYDGGQNGSFFDESFILGLSPEVDEDNNAGSGMLGLIGRGKWAIGGGEEVTCSVCLDEFSEGQEVMTMACKHTFHEQCLLTWLDRNQTCPLCRRPN